MTDRLTLSLWEEGQAHKAINHLWKNARVAVREGRRMVAELRPEKRSDAQNALLHALLTEIAKTHEWAGAKRDVETWKRLLTAAWLRARGESVEVLPALDGCGIDVVFRRTSSLTKAECGELVDFIEAWRAGA
ncbi:MAG: recombination protein NinB [Delftia acidovorans]|nr:recombination protein NinB [Delftia acidovorans]